MEMHISQSNWFLLFKNGILYDFKNEVDWKTAHKWVPVYLVDNVPCLSKNKFGIQTLLIQKTNWYFDLIINNNHHEIKNNNNNNNKNNNFNLKKKKTTNNTLFNKKRSNSPFFKLRRRQW